MFKRILAAVLAAVLLVCGCALAEVVKEIVAIEGTVEARSIEVTPAPAEGIITEAPLNGIQIVKPDASAEPVETSAVLQASASPEPTLEPTPTAEPRLHGLIIGIDPGHQGQGNYDKEPVGPDTKEMKAKVSSGTSGVSTGIAEYVTVLEISLKLREALEEMGCSVYMTRDTHEIDISNKERAEMMNELGADLVLRLHCDGAEDRSANGIGMFVRKTGEKQEESQAAAEVLLDAMVESTGAKKRGVFLRDTYTMNNWSIVPCILVEMGFMSNPEEDEKLNNPEYQELLVQGMAEGICRYFER